MIHFVPDFGIVYELGRIRSRSYGAVVHPNNYITLHQSRLERDTGGKPESRKELDAGSAPA
jgi:hypothetical protein